MNRNPKHAPPGALLKKVISGLIVQREKKAPNDCAFCRNSEFKGVFVCKLERVMDALTCPDFKDSRLPSSLIPYTAENKGDA